MWRLVAFILICALFLVFVVLNLEHTSDVSFGFRTFYDIPVFLTAFSAFVIGMLFAIPFVLSFGKKHKKSPPSPCYEASHTGGEKQAAVQKKPPRFKKKKDTPGTDPVKREHILSPDTTADAVKKEKSPYGID